VREVGETATGCLLDHSNRGIATGFVGGSVTVAGRIASLMVASRLFDKRTSATANATEGNGTRQSASGQTVWKIRRAVQRARGAVPSCRGSYR